MRGRRSTLAHGVGEHSPSRHDQQPSSRRGRGNRRQRRVEERGVREKTAAQLDDRVDHFLAYGGFT